MREIAGHYGPAHYETAGSLHNLAGLLQAQRDHAGALERYQRALTILETTRGPTHLDTAATLNSLALVVAAQRGEAAARPLVERARAIVEQKLGPITPAHAWCAPTGRGWYGSGTRQARYRGPL